MELIRLDYRKLLEYYLTSDEWKTTVVMFFEVFDHCHDPDEGTARAGTACCYSEVYTEYVRKLAADGGYPAVTLTDRQFQKYFSRRYSEDQRFAVLFGIWWGLQDEQLAWIRNPRQRKHCWELLNLFLHTQRRR